MNDGVIVDWVQHDSQVEILYAKRAINPKDRWSGDVSNKTTSEKKSKTAGNNNNNNNNIYYNHVVIEDGRLLFLEADMKAQKHHSKQRSEKQKKK